jgi:hypothetical protein
MVKVVGCYYVWVIGLSKGHNWISCFEKKTCNFVRALKE